MMGGFISAHGPLDLINFERLVLNLKIYIPCLTCFQLLQFSQIMGSKRSSVNGDGWPYCNCLLS